MLILTETTDKIQVVLGGAVTANQLQCFSSWRDITATTYAPGRTVVNTNDTTDVDVVGAPGSDTQRVVDLINVFNKDTVQALVTVKLDANGTEYILWKGYVGPNQTLSYVDGSGWSTVNGYRPIKVYLVHSDAGANFAMTNATQAERFAGNSTRSIVQADLAGYTQVRLRGMVMVASASANTPLFRAKYYTEYSATVGNYLQLGADSQVQYSVAATGYLDTGWLALASGAQIDGAFIGFTELGGDAAADPALGHTEILFR